MNHKPLEAQRAMITGGSSGIGAAIAKAFSEAGAAVVINHNRDALAAKQLVNEITAKEGRAVAVNADVTKPKDCKRLFEVAVKHFGGIDILVANAGIERDKAFTKLSLKDWQEVINVNLTSQFLCAQEAVRLFRRQGLEPRRSRALGKVLFMSSVHQAIPWAGHANYAASKGGSKLLMESMAQELASERIRVNAVAPGAIKTSINQSAWKTPAARRKLQKLIPYPRIGEVKDVADAAVWLVSDAADYVVGTTLFVDGGMALYPAFRGGG